MLLILGYKGDPSLIVPLRRTPGRFRKGELYRLILKREAEGSNANKETARRIVAMKRLGAVTGRADKAVRQYRESPAKAEGSQCPYGWVAPNGLVAQFLICDNFKLCGRGVHPQ
ncbi:hypothetical protein ACWGTO_09930 [Mesorhizobium sp. PL10]